MNRASDQNEETLELPLSAREEITTRATGLDSLAAGRYLIQRLLGEGGAKQVYLAHDARLDRDVVIALVKPAQMDEQSVTRLIREAQAMGRLGDHPNIVTVFDAGEEAGRPYIVSRHVEGGSVRELMNNYEDGKVPVEKTIRIAEQVCQALAHAHNQGIVHRDV